MKDRNDMWPNEKHNDQCVWDVLCNIIVDINGYVAMCGAMIDDPKIRFVVNI